MYHVTCLVRPRINLLVGYKTSLVILFKLSNYTSRIFLVPIVAKYNLVSFLGRGSFIKKGPKSWNLEKKWKWSSGRRTDVPRAPRYFALPSPSFVSARARKRPLRRRERLLTMSRNLPVTRY